MSPFKLDKKKIRFLLKKVLLVLFFIIVFLGLFLVCVANWYKTYYSDIPFAQLLYHIYAPLEGTDTSFMDTFYPACLPIPIIGTAFVVFLFFYKKKKLQNPILNKRINIGAWIVSICLCCFGVSSLCTNMNIEEYVETTKQTSDNLYEDYYVDAKDVSFTFPKTKRNLIYIFMESMESTYEDEDNGGMTDTNYIPELTKLQNNNLTFNGGDASYNGYYVPEASGWTIAGIVGQTSGTPLVVNGDLANNLSDGDFLPNATSVGDILKEAGYNQEFMCGSDIEFGGRANYLEQHGDYDIFDLNYARENGYIDANYGVWWGYEDTKLFSFAQKECTRLASEEEPFNLTLLTADTHAPNGYKCDNCEDEYSENYSNVMACSSKQVAAFIEWIQKQDFYKNTTIVIAGDHKTMDTNWFKNKDSSGYTRKAFYTIINSPLEPERTEGRKISTYDLFPTTIASLGITFDSDRLGLGTNLYGSEDTLVEIMGYKKFNSKCSQSSDYYINYLFGGRDVTKKLTTGDEEDDSDNNTEFELPQYYTGTYNYYSGITYYSDGSSSDGEDEVPSSEASTPSSSDNSSDNSGQDSSNSDKTVDPGGTSSDTGGGSSTDSGGTSTDTGGGTSTDTGTVTPSDSGSVPSDSGGADTTVTE